MLPYPTTQPKRNTASLKMHQETMSKDIIAASNAFRLFLSIVEVCASLL